MVALAGGGCGTRGAGDQVEEVVTTYLDALAAGDGAKACARMTAQKQARVVDDAAAAGFEADTCAAVVSEVGATLAPLEQSELRSARPVKVSVRGSSATVTFRHTQTPGELVRRDGRWLIASGLFGENALPARLDRGEDEADPNRQRIAAARGRLRAFPRDRRALGELIRAHYGLATAGSAPADAFREDARRDLRAAVEAWRRYLAASRKPDLALARIAVQAHVGLAQLDEAEKDTYGAREAWAGAAAAQEVIAAARRTSSEYVALVQFASAAGQTQKADLAGRKAIDLAPKNRRRAVRDLVVSAKAIAQGG